MLFKKFLVFKNCKRSKFILKKTLGRFLHFWDLSNKFDIFGINKVIPWRCIHLCNNLKLIQTSNFEQPGLKTMNFLPKIEAYLSAAFGWINVKLHWQKIVVYIQWKSGSQVRVKTIFLQKKNPGEQKILEKHKIIKISLK